MDKNDNGYQLVDISKLELRFALDMHYALFTNRDDSDDSIAGGFNSSFLSSVDYLTYNVLLFFAREVMHLTVLRYEGGQHHFISRSSWDEVPKVDALINAHEVFPFSLED